MLILKIIVLILCAGLLTVIRYYKRASYITIIEGKGKGQTRQILSFDINEKAIKISPPFDPMPDGTSKYMTWRRKI